MKNCLIQNPITDHKVIAERVMNHLWGKKGKDWDVSSKAHGYWKRWSRKHFSRLKEMKWHQIYKEARVINDKW